MARRKRAATETGSGRSLAAQAREDLGERKNMPIASRKLRRKLREHHSQSPKLTSGDVDAAWDYARAAGEETPGGTVPTPDQDVVDDIGRAAGVVDNDDEPLGFDRKVLSRDRNRWELNPASADDKAEADVGWDELDDEAELLDEYTEDDET